MFARHTALCAVAAGLTVLALRAALLGVWEIPRPYVHDEFGYLLQADTFASGRLTNATHPLADFFETPYVLQTPSYAAKYPPAQGLFLALGQKIFGHPWFGVWLSCGMLAAAVCWALQGWFPPVWALFGTALVLPLCVLSLWMNSYWGGAVAGIGSALVFGAVPRIRRGNLVLPAVVALGAAVLALARPFEGLVAMVPVAVLLFRRLDSRQWLSFGCVALAGVAWTGYYNARVTGSAVRLPYVEYDAQNPMTPHFNFLPLPPPKAYRTTGMKLVADWERQAWMKAREPRFVRLRLASLYSRVTVLLGSRLLLLPLLLSLPWWFVSPKLRVIRWALALSLVVPFVEVTYFEHYFAPALVPLLVLVVQGFRYARQWRVSANYPVGAWIARMAPAAMLLVAAGGAALAIRRGAAVNPLSARSPEVVAEQLADLLGQHVIVVRHTKPPAFPDWSRYPRVEQAPLSKEFVHNGANVDRQTVIWAHDLGALENQRLRAYYTGRTFWLYQPDEDPSRLQRLPDIQ